MPANVFGIPLFLNAAICLTCSIGDKHCNVFVKTEKKYTSTLVADNDDGKSVLFEVEIII